MSDIINKLNYVNDSYKDCFTNSLPSFHGVLWNLLIEEVHKEKEKAFTINISSGVGYQLGLAIKNEKGYIPLGVYFNRKEYRDYKKASEILEKINKQVFNLDINKSAEIVFSSF
jgi:hypothetical protein